LAVQIALSVAVGSAGGDLVFDHGVGVRGKCPTCLGEGPNPRS
jgi:hypothetical protein